MNGPIARKAILYLVSFFIAFYGIVYIYLGYKFGELYLFLLGGVFFTSSVMLLLRYWYSGYFVLTCFLMILAKIIISNGEMLLASILNVELSTIFGEIGGELFVAFLFLVFTFISFKLKKTP